ACTTAIFPHAPWPATGAAQGLLRRATCLWVRRLPLCGRGRQPGDDCEKIIRAARLHEYSIGDFLRSLKMRHPCFPGENHHRNIVGLLLLLDLPAEFKAVAVA